MKPCELLPNIQLTRHCKHTEFLLFYRTLNVTDWNFLEHIFRLFMIAFCDGCTLFRGKLASWPGNPDLDNRQNKCINNQVHTHVYLILRSNFFSRRHTTGISKDSLRYLSTTFQASFSSEYALILIHSRCGFNLPNRKSQMYQSVSQTN